MLVRKTQESFESVMSYNFGKMLWSCLNFNEHYVMPKMLLENQISTLPYVFYKIFLSVTTYYPTSVNF